MPSTPAAGNTDTAHFCTKVLQPVAEANRIADASLKDENQRPPDTIIMRLPFSVHSARDCCRISDSSAESSMRRLISSATCVFTDQAGPRHPWITEVTNAGNERTNRRVCVCVCVCVPQSSSKHNRSGCSTSFPITDRDQYSLFQSQLLM